jgi:hypothetical protein
VLILQEAIEHPDEIAEADRCVVAKLPLRSTKRSNQRTCSKQDVVLRPLELARTAHSDHQYVLP